ncbi:MAG: hypothetical protein M0Z52_03335 [Actinomycetota bacterium]|nr:hypothetical protein [Actinomycetota bacterium]
MKRAFQIAVLVLSALLPGMALAAQAQTPSVKLEKLLNPDVARTAKLGALVNCVAVTPDGIAVVGDADRLWLVGASGARATGVRGLSSFAFTSQGLLIGVRGRDLVYLDADGTLKTFFGLPGEEMSIVPGQGDTLLLYGPEGKDSWGLYIIHPGRRVSKLLKSPKPITGAAMAGNRVLLVAGGALYEVLKGKLLLVAGEPGGAFVSVAAEPAGSLVFVSDGKRIFGIQGNQVMPLAGDIGGILRWQGGGLLIFDPGRDMLLRLVAQ